MEARVEAMVAASVVVAFASRSAPSSSVSVLSVSREESKVEVTPADAAVDSYNCASVLQQKNNEARRFYEFTLEISSSRVAIMIVAREVTSLVMLELSVSVNAEAAPVSVMAVSKALLTVL